MAGARRAIVPQRALGADGRTIGAAVDQHRRVPEAAALRAWRHRARRLSRLSCAASAGPQPRALVRLCQRRARSSISVPAATAPKKSLPAKANGRGWSRPLRAIARRAGLRARRAVRRSADAPHASASRLRLETRRLPDAGQEAAQIQSVALGRDRARRHRHQRRLRAHLSRHGASERRRRATGKSSAICGRAISAPTSPKSAGPRSARGCADAEAALEHGAAAPTLAPQGDADRRHVIIDIETPALSRAAGPPARACAVESLHFAGDASARPRRPAAWAFRRHRIAGRLVHRRLRVRSAGRAQDHRSGMVRGAAVATRRRRRCCVRAHRDAQGPDRKDACAFCATEPRVDFDLTFHWTDWGKGSLRLGHFTLLPDAFDWTKLSLTTHNGGKTSGNLCARRPRRRPWRAGVVPGLGVARPRHDRGLGRARRRQARGCASRSTAQTAPLLGLLTHRAVGGSLFCQFVLSALELDDTRKPSPYRDRPAPLPIQRKRSVAVSRLLTVFCNHCRSNQEGEPMAHARAEDLSRRDPARRR